MLKVLLLSFFVTFAHATTNCDSLYTDRHLGQEASTKAFECYSRTLSSAQTRADQALILTRMSYLKFTIAEFYLELKLDALYEAFTLGERAILLFGAKYDLDAYASLSESELDVLGEAFYSYGVSLSRYVDLKGRLEAIKRMEDIKKSMNSILRINRENTVFFGAYRTLGIFHLKVPSIAGGQIQLSRPYLEKAIQGSIFRGGLSRYPGNNLSYAEVLFKLSKSAEGCAELKNLGTLTEADLALMDNGYVLETKSALTKAAELRQLKKCP